MGVGVFAVLIPVGVLGGAQACSPVPGWNPMTVPELVALAPIVASVQIKSVSGDFLGGQNATASVKCVVKNKSGSPLPKHMKITGFGSSSLCLSEATIGYFLAFLDILDLTTKPPTYKLVYSDINAGTKPATSDNLAAAKSVMVPGELDKNDSPC